MKILKLSQYCYPEQVSSSHLTVDLEERLIQEGFTIEVFSPTPTRGITPEVREEYKKKKYEELYNGKKIIHRFSMFGEGKNTIMRALRYMLISWKQYFKGIHAKDIDMIYVGSTPPTQGMLCALVRKRLVKKQKRYIPIVYNLQDVFPDSLETTGIAKKGSFFYKIGTKIANYTYKQADSIIVISNDIKKNIMEKGVPEEKIHVVYNWIDTEKTQPVQKDNNKLYDELNLSKEAFTIVYAGNLGKAQDIDMILDAAKQLSSNEKIQFVIFGGGAEENKLKKRVEDENITNVKMLPLLPRERVPEVYSLGDACIVCCKKGTGSAGVPSKTWSIMACQTPVLVAFDEDSELYNLVNNNGLGLCSPAGDANAFINNVLELFNDHNKCTLLGKNARKYAEDYASKNNATSAYVSVFNAELKKVKK